MDASVGAKRVLHEAGSGKAERSKMSRWIFPRITGAERREWMGLGEWDHSEELLWVFMGHSLIPYQAPVRFRSLKTCNTIQQLEVEVSPVSPRWPRQSE